MMYGIFSSGAPSYSDTLNIGLLNDKTNLVTAGGFLFVSGVSCVALESVARRLIAAFGPQGLGSVGEGKSIEDELARYGV
jgi:hypothetical protein